MNAEAISPGSGYVASCDAVRQFRYSAAQNGYSLIRVRSKSKQPLPRDWQHGDQEEALLGVSPEAMNTGVLLAGLRCIDIDVDDPEIVRGILKIAQQHLPARPIVRCRPGSPRMALLYRAASGAPGKLSASGALGKIEVLGRGQQVVCDGVHPSGAAITWTKERGPHTVPCSQLPAVSEDQINRFLAACTPLLGMETRFGGLGPTGADLLLAANDELMAGVVPSHWFEALPPEGKSSLVRSCLTTLNNRENDPREVWLRVIFACAHAERLGCPDAYQQALAWSMQGASWTSEQDFQKAWGSAKPDKPSGISIGTLIAMARAAGLDVTPWRMAAADERLTIESSAHDGAEAATSGAPAPPPSPRALSVADLPVTPPKREWLHGTDLLRGAVSLIVAPGARGKSSWLTSLALACASGRPLLGAHVFGGPLRVLLINAEDPTSEIALRVRASMRHHGIADADVHQLQVAGADRLRPCLLRANGSTAALDAAGWSILNAELDRIQPDVLIVDPLISMMGAASTNDNAGAALLMGQLVATAAQRRMSIMVAHHAAKGRDPASAEAAMGAASFVNLARIALAIEPLAESDAGRVGLPPWDARSVFRIVGTKQNLSAPDATDRWFRLTSVEMDNAQPPIYPTGDRVGVVEVFRPGASGPMFSHALICDALRVIDSANPPLSPAKRAGIRWAAPSIAAVIAPHRNGRASEGEGVAVLEHLKRSGLVIAQPVKLQRSGGRSDMRDGLVLTAAGKSALQPTGGFMPP